MANFVRPFEWVGCQRCRFWGSWLYYKAREGSLNERLTYMKALRHANNIDVNRYPGMRSNDVFLQMIDLDKGIYGQPFLVSLFLHNQAREERSIKITMITNSMYYTGHKVNFWPCQRNLIKTFRNEANTPLIMVGKVFIHFPLYLVWSYDLFWFWTLPTKFCVTAQ